MALKVSIVAVSVAVALGTSFLIYYLNNLRVRPFEAAVTAQPAAGTENSRPAVPINYQVPEGDIKRPASAVDFSKPKKPTGSEAGGANPPRLDKPILSPALQPPAPSFSIKLFPFERPAPPPSSSLANVPADFAQLWNGFTAALNDTVATFEKFLAAYGGLPDLPATSTAEIMTGLKNAALEIPALKNKTADLDKKAGAVAGNLSLVIKAGAKAGAQTAVDQEKIFSAGTGGYLDIILNLSQTGAGAAKPAAVTSAYHAKYVNVINLYTEAKSIANKINGALTDAYYANLNGNQQTASQLFDQAKADNAALPAAAENLNSALSDWGMENQSTPDAEIKGQTFSVIASGQGIRQPTYYKPGVYIDLIDFSSVVNSASKPPTQAQIEAYIKIGGQLALDINSFETKSAALQGLISDKTSPLIFTPEIKSDLEAKLTAAAQAYLNILDAINGFNVANAN